MIWPTTRRKTIRALAAITAIAIALAACGDDSGADSTTTAPPVATTTSVAPTSAPPTTTQPPRPESVGEPRIADYVTAAYPGHGQPSYLEAVRTESHDGFIRVVFEFAAGAPEFRVEYADLPVLASPSGEEIAIEGQSALLISLAPASAVDLTGPVPVSSYTGPDRLDVEGPMVNELVKTEDFENHMTWAIGLEEELPYSFETLPDAGRLVIDLHLADLTAVAEYDDGERAFAVEAFATESDACVAVRADDVPTKTVETLCLRPKFGHPITYETAWIDDVPVIVGVVFDEAVADIDLVAVDGTLISEDSEEFSLVDIGNGVRAFAPRINPLFLREIRVLDEDGTLVLQAQVTV